jgi:hypothetical protein
MDEPGIKCAFNQSPARTLQLCELSILVAGFSHSKTLTVTVTVPVKSAVVTDGPVRSQLVAALSV